MNVRERLARVGEEAVRNRLVQEAANMSLARVFTVNGTGHFGPGPVGTQWSQVNDYWVWQVDQGPGLVTRLRVAIPEGTTYGAAAELLRKVVQLLEERANALGGPDKEIAPPEVG